MSSLPRSERPTMAGYGVTADPEGLLPWAWAEERLVGSRNYWLVTADGTGRPHAMPVWGVWIPDRQRWGFGCAPDARKLRNIRANDRVVVTIDDTVECVSLEGTAIEVSADDAEPLVDAWADKYHDATASKEELAGFLRDSALIEVVPERAFGLIERPDDFARAATRWVWG